MEVLAGLRLDDIGLWVAFILTLMVFSYLLRDNPLYRLAQYLLVGSVAGYAIVVAYHSVLRPRLIEPLLSDPASNGLLIAPLLLAVLLLAKGRRPIAWLGNISMAYLFGVGAALAIGGALIGSLAAQVQASWFALQPGAYAGWPFLGTLSAIIMLVGVTGALIYFYYSHNDSVAGKPKPAIAALRRAWGRVGYWFILIMLGALFANLIISRLSLLIGRIRFILDTLGRFIG